MTSWNMTARVPDLVKNNALCKYCYCYGCYIHVNISAIVLKCYKQLYNHLVNRLHRIYHTWWQYAAIRMLAHIWHLQLHKWVSSHIRWNIVLLYNIIYYIMCLQLCSGANIYCRGFNYLPVTLVNIFHIWPLWTLFEFCQKFSHFLDNIGLHKFVTDYFNLGMFITHTYMWICVCVYMWSI